MSSGSYIAYMMIRKAQIEQEEESIRRWNSYTKEQKEAIYKFDRWWYEYKKKKEQEQYEEICNLLKKILKPFSYIKNKIVCFIDLLNIYLYIFFKRYYAFKPNYFFEFDKDILKYSYVFEPIKYIDLNDYQTVGRILINVHNVNFRKLKEVILVKYKDFENRSIYLKNISKNCKFLTNKDMCKLYRIFKNNLIRRY